MVRDLHETNSARDREEDAPEPPQIRRFRRLVSLTMVAMVIGMLGIMGALVWKLTQTPSNNPAEMMTGEIELPSGFEIINVSRWHSHFVHSSFSTSQKIRLHFF